MLLILKELFNPKLKCKRIGHKPKEVNRRIRTGMNDYWQKVLICCRCGIVIKEISREHLREYHSVAMPSHYWDEIEEKGYIVMSKDKV